MEIQLFTEQTEKFIKWINSELNEKKYDDQSHKPFYPDTILDFPDISLIITDILTVMQHKALLLLILSQRLGQDPIMQQDGELIATAAKLMDHQQEAHRILAVCMEQINENDPYEKDDE